MSNAKSVDDFLKSLQHKRRADIGRLRQIILSAAPEITEHIKWNAPSFCWKGEDRITMRLHPADRLELIFHRGAKKQDSAEFSFEDSSGLIVWAAKDRGIMPISDLDLEKDAITKVVRSWLAATSP